MSDRAQQGQRRILVVDDDPHIRRLLRTYLEADGFVVDEACTGEEAWQSVSQTAPAVVLLDVGLPDVDGLEVLRQLREHSQVFVILVTARNEELDKLVGLTVGADDYITKPFSPREVVARVNTVLRRHRGSSWDVLGAGESVDRWVFPGLVVDGRRREVYLDEQEVVLSTLEFNLLWTFAGDAGRVFTRVQLLERVWGYDFFGDERVVDVHVRNIRRSLRDQASRPRIIGTVRGVGYKFLLRPEMGSAQRGDIHARQAASVARVVGATARAAHQPGSVRAGAPRG
ncbi:Transcriptional regulatory protein SrrA [Austwickia sp. TVS 96-490-7B]|uniref:response regulator transcription factor n=1 Tax=Austwickia sp. TVS 96-490-7B TaxID=2830843 RepID=UPI001C59240E|nr:response regulator transcription factor [Austwickia sp. TVS 96-490-7B]MBW3085186.1 Transcriptional regulatory protein SrrA [Austwickia sp. TVS 96-490-7B]